MTHSLAARFTTAIFASDPTPSTGGGGGGLGDVQAPSAPSWLNTGAIIGIALFLACLLLMVLGISQIGRSRKGNVKEAASQSAVAGIGVLWIVIGITGAAIGIIAGTVSYFSTT